MKCVNFEAENIRVKEVHKAINPAIPTQAEISLRLIPRFGEITACADGGGKGNRREDEELKENGV